MESIYSRVCWLAFYTPHLAAKNPDLDQMIGRGTFAAGSDGRLVRTTTASHVRDAESNLNLDANRLFDAIPASYLQLREDSRRIHPSLSRCRR
ncbi:hypothetical protein N7465_000003 [Penicillium sp. CMV-2018d]|nr:hypothetical protein N7465_000003 [Penicillium sp. CMV-2018d]